MSVEVTDAWRTAFPAARVGLLVLEEVSNPPHDDVLEQYVREVEDRLRRKFANAHRGVLVNLPAIEAYQRHYRAFGQTYHVLRQLESVALKGRPLASSGVLVSAMFAAEIDTLLLTAGHDRDALEPPLVIDCSGGGERFIGIGGQEHVLRPNDMLMRDSQGIISAVVYGPDQRTRLHDDTRRVLFTTYAPEGIGDAVIRGHMEQIAANVRLASPNARTTLMALYP